VNLAVAHEERRLAYDPVKRLPAMGPTGHYRRRLEVGGFATGSMTLWRQGDLISYRSWIQDTTHPAAQTSFSSAQRKPPSFYR